MRSELGEVRTSSSGAGETLRANQPSSLVVLGQTGDESDLGELHEKPSHAETRSEHIERLRDHIADGTYHVSAEELADKLILSMLVDDFR